ncbi:MAG: acyl-CoA dehydrogenase family protein [Proteobacteria bacterium]|nr:acyl-CoA dehydrogenase family protein [Pseudomonadota bacterium]
MSDDIKLKGGGFLLAELAPEDVFTPEDMTEEHKMILETTHDFIQGEILPNTDKIEEKDKDLIRSILVKAGELGLNGTDIPEEFGGLGLDKISTAAVTEAMGTSGSFAVAHGAHTGIGTLPTVYFGTKEQKEKYLPGLSSGEIFGAYALTEAGAGSDATNAKTKAVLSEDGKHYVLNGEKMFITNAGWADLFTVYAMIDGEQFTAFLVEAGYPGVSTGAEEVKMGIKGSSTRTLVLEDAKVPVENLLHQIGKGHQVAFNILNIGRYKLAAACVGGCKSIVGDAVKYANQRVQFGKPISSFGMIREKLARMVAKTYMTEAMVYRTSGLIDAEAKKVDLTAEDAPLKSLAAIEEYAVECSINKVYGSETLDYCTDEFVQILGGYGYVAEYPAERAYRDARINRIFEGTNEINRLLVPGTLLRRAMKGALPLLPAAQAVQGDLMTYTTMGLSIPDEPLAMAEHMIGMSKKTALLVAGVAVQKFMQNLANEQEVLARIADILIEIYAMESGCLRAKKALAGRGEDKAALHLACVNSYVDETVPRIEAWAREALAFCEEGDTLRTILMGVKKFMKYTPTNAVALRRQIADKVVELERWPI